MSKFIFNDLNSKSKVFDNSARINHDNYDHNNSSSEYDEDDYDLNNNAENDDVSENVSLNDADDIDSRNSESDGNGSDVNGSDNEDTGAVNGNDGFESSDDSTDNDSLDDHQSQADDEDIEHIESMTTDFSGMRMKDTIPSELANSYLKVKINDTLKFLHKQAAVWLLTDKNDRLSSDRLSRVMGRG
ncbi:unnamed protein product [Adineta steineri]|uniref:Uncharacterized protein n=1 Tax=Adineta steineri TaxID=433720 RepID=A0A815TCN7_9BILA|nr:unnamed protein product [Adineta steineri]